MLTVSAADALRARFLQARFGVDAITERLGPEAVAALGRNSTIPARRALAGARDPLATLIRLWLLQQPVALDDAAAALGELAPLDALLERRGDEVRALVDIRPYAVEGLLDGWICSDLIPTLDGRNGATRPDFVLGLSPASTTLAQLTIRRPGGSALDLGTGCGVQSLHLAASADRVVATDLNPRAIALAGVTALLNDVSLDLRLGSLYEPVAEERFDLIVTNPPYVMSPPTGERLVYREGTMTGDGLVQQVVTRGAAHLNPGGVLQVLGNWAITDQPWEERLRGWIDPTGCDALVLERERLDPAEYVEIWLADAGLAGAPDYAQRYDAWLNYFAELGIVGVGMGWLALYNSGRERPAVRLERWPHLVQQPVGPAFGEFPRAAGWADEPEAALFAGRWRLAEGIVQETMGVPGAEDPEHIVLRSSRGFGRAHQVDTALGGVLGACDGDIPLGDLVDAVADLLDADAAALRAQLLAPLRAVIADGMLIR